MFRAISRRAALGALCSAAAGSALVGRVGASRDEKRSERFDPAVHGFGFRNWSTAASAYPEHDHEAVSEAKIRRTVRREWRDPLDRLLDLDVDALPEALVDLVARQLYVTVNQQSATNGHCYGMVFTAQRYFERPESIPLGRESASRLTHPEETDGGGESVGADIDHFQNRQFLSVYSWLGRRRAFYPTEIDYRAELATLTAAVDEYGTAGITVFNRSSLYSHQVLVYDYERDAGGITLRIYDPNIRAPFYARNPDAVTLRVDATDEGFVARPYRRYESFLYNRWDRAILAEDVPDPAPVRSGRGRLRDVVSGLALFLVDSPAVDVVVTGPNGNRVSRYRSAFADRRRTEYCAARYRYGAPAGTYRIAVLARDDAEYTLTADAASVDGVGLDSEVTATIESGETHEYVASVPESGGEGDLSRGDGGWARTVGALGGGAAVGGVAAHALRRRRGDGE